MRRTAGETKNRSATLGASEATLDHLIQDAYPRLPLHVLTCMCGTAQASPNHVWSQIGGGGERGT